MTPHQAKLYRFLLDRRDDPVSPTYAEMADVLGFSSKSGTHRVVKALIEMGKVTSVPGAVRSIRAVPPSAFDGIPSADLWAELKRRGEVAHAG